MSPRPARVLAPLLLLALVSVLSSVAPLMLPADHAAIHFSGYVEKEITADGAVRFHRILDGPSRGYRWDNPGARVRFRTDALGLTAHLRDGDKHTSPSEVPPWAFS